MSTFSIPDQIWNRACLGEADDPKRGDVALSALLAFHGPAMNGGVLHSVELLTSEQLQASSEGFRYYGLAPIAALIDDAARAVRVGEDLDELEEKLDQSYSEHIPTDATLSAAFEKDFAEHPENYQPISPGSHL